MRTLLSTVLTLTLTAGCSLTAQLSSKFGSGSRSTGGSSSGASPGGSSSPQASSLGDPRAAPASYSEDCERYPSISEPLGRTPAEGGFNVYEPILMLARCPDSVPPNDPVDEYGSARAWLRGWIDQGIATDTPQLPRAAYVHLCARQMAAEDGKLYPAMAIGCAWHADRLDLKALAKELEARPASQRGVMAKQFAADVTAVRQRALAAFPRASSAREWEVFYELPMKIRAAVVARRSTHAKAYQRLVAFETAIEGGKFEGCAAPLRDSLATYLRGAKTLPAIRERITDPLGYALADALARCHYYNERELKAGAVLAFLDKARRQTTLAEQVRFAQIDALAGDAEKAKKFPNLVGSKYSSVDPTDLRPVEPWGTKLDLKWRAQKYELLRFQTSEGRVARLEKKAKGTTIHFKKERVPVVDVRCRETNRIDSITSDGKIIYREECTRTPKGHTWDSPSPVTVDEANGVSPGRFVRLGVDGDHGVVLTSTDSPNDSSGANRIADVVLGG